MSKVKWMMSYRFCSKFDTLSNSENFFNRSRHTKLQRVSRLELFRDTV